MASPKVFLTNLQKSAKFSVAWNRGHLRDFIVKELTNKTIAVGIEHTSISKILQEDDHCRQLILEKNLKIHQALSSLEKESPAFTIYSSAGESPLINKVGIQVKDSFRRVLSEIGPNTFLRIDGSLRVEKKETDNDSEYDEDEAELQFPPLHFNMRMCADNMLPSNSIFPFSEQVKIPEGGECELHFNLDNISVEWQVPGRAICLDTRLIIGILHEDKYSMDCTIEAIDGEVKCHSFILTGNSEVFKRMLSSEAGWIEGNSHRIEMNEMSQQCVEYFVALFYGIEVDPNVAKCNVVVQLFKAAEKYDISNLLNSLRGTLMAKGKDWYEPDAILELFEFVNLLRTEKPLMNHVIHVMNRMTPRIRTCERFKRMTKIETESVMWALHESMTISFNHVCKIARMAQPKLEN